MGVLYINKSPIHGVGVFTRVNIPNNTRMFLAADLNDYKKGGNCMTKQGALVNHKEPANCVFFEDENNGKVYLKSIKNITLGEELTIDYSVLPFPFKSDVTGYKK